MVRHPEFLLQYLDRLKFMYVYFCKRYKNGCFTAKVRDFERGFYNATCVDAVRFVRKDKFLEAGGFDENLIFGPDDWDFDRRIREKGKVGMITSFLFHNEGKFNLRRYLKKKSHYAKSFDKYIQKWGEDDPIVRKQLGAYYRFFGVFVEGKKWKKLIRHPVLTLVN